MQEPNRTTLIVQQIKADAFITSQKRGIGTAGIRNTGFEKPYMSGQWPEFYSCGNMAVFIEYGGTQPIEAETAAAFPSHGFGNAALLAIDHFLQARGTMRHGMVAHFNADIAAAHFVRDGGGCGGAEKTVENEVTNSLLFAQHLRCFVNFAISL